MWTILVFDKKSHTYNLYMWQNEKIGVLLLSESSFEKMARLILKHGYIVRSIRVSSK